MSLPECSQRLGHPRIGFGYSVYSKEHEYLNKSVVRDRRRCIRHGYKPNKGIIKVEDYGNRIWNEVSKIDLNLYTEKPVCFYWPPRCMNHDEGRIDFFPSGKGRVAFDFETREFIWSKRNEDDTGFEYRR